jgi:drug/metabolite transporter (DMT)-like permease
VTALLALLSAVLIGSADFLGGMTSRSANGIRLATAISAVGLPLALVGALAVPADAVSRADVVWSLLAGIFVSVGLGCFYLGMGRGLISVVAPLAAVTGAVIPVVYAVARGERPGPVAVVGLVAALVAVGVVSMAPSQPHPDVAVADATVLFLALAAGLLFGLFYVAFSRVSDDAVLWPVAIERSSATAALVVFALVATRGPFGSDAKLARVVVVIAVLEIAATVLVLLALQRGPIAIASVVASLYPVTTVILAGVVLRERLSRLQYAGVVCALLAVVLVSTG